MRCPRPAGPIGGSLVRKTRERRSAEEKRAWIDRAVLALIIPVGGTVLSVKRLRGPRFYKLELQAQGSNAPGAGHGAAAAVDPHEPPPENEPFTKPPPVV